MPGIYIHVPFCDGKCPYCDFYSLRAGEELMEQYASAVERALQQWAAERGKGSVKTVYFGGGTPSLLGAGRLSRLLSAVDQSFFLDSGAEITLEANPVSVDRAFFEEVRRAGFNRLSMGMQSADPEELALLGRRHSPEDVKEAVEAARLAGFFNLSLDLMLGLPKSAPEEGPERLGRSIAFAAGLEPEHLSSYILKVEPGTPFASRQLVLPEDDEIADQYLFCVQELEKYGYQQYEISNFAKPGRESRHNLVYWHGEEYLGFGPGAHSFFAGKRFYYPRSLSDFLEGKSPCPDGEGGDFEEYAMLNLRLTEGLCRESCRARFGAEGERGFARLLQNAKKCPPQLLRADEGKISFTPRGFLVFNALFLKLSAE